MINGDLLVFLYTGLMQYLWTGKQKPIWIIPDIALYTTVYGSYTLIWKVGWSIVFHYYLQYNMLKCELFVNVSYSVSESEFIYNSDNIHVVDFMADIVGYFLQNTFYITDAGVLYMNFVWMYKNTSHKVVVFPQLFKLSPQYDNMPSQK